MTIRQQVDLAISRASVCLGSLSPENQAALAARMQGVVDALEDDSQISWAAVWPNRSAQCEFLADGAAHHLASYRLLCLNWESSVIHQLNLLAAVERSVGCDGAAEVAAGAVRAEGEAAAEVLPSVGNLEVPGFIQWGAVAIVAIALVRVFR